VRSEYRSRSLQQKAGEEFGNYGRAFLPPVAGLLGARKPVWSGRQNIHSSTFAVKAYNSIRKSIQGIVFAPADIPAWMELGAALPDDDSSGADALAAEDLDAEPLACRFAAVAYRTLSFFMCHCCLAGVLISLLRSLLLGRVHARDLDVGSPISPLRRRHELDLFAGLIIAVARAPEI